MNIFTVLGYIFVSSNLLNEETIFFHNFALVWRFEKNASVVQYILGSGCVKVCTLPIIQ